jgi:hypothetical protein
VGTKVVREGKVVSARDFKKKHKLTKEQFAGKLKYLRSQLRAAFKGTPVNIVISNVNAGKGEYMLQVVYGE